MPYDENRPLMLYKASAGTGKTYTLAKRFVELSIMQGNPYAFARILAVTFTRKATAEMKLRIVKFLSSLRDDSDPQLMQGVLDELNGMGLQLSKRDVQARAGHTLHIILHEYSRFTISTIDSFLKDMATSLFWELGISPDVAVRLDEQNVLQEATISLLQNLANPEEDEAEPEAEQKQELYRFLQDFMQERMMEQGKRTLLEDLQPVGKEIFREPFVRKSLKEQRAMLNLKARQALRKLLQAEREASQKRVVSAFQGFESYVQQEGFLGAIHSNKKTQRRQLSSLQEVAQLDKMPTILLGKPSNFTKKLTLAGPAREQFIARANSHLFQAREALLGMWTFDAALGLFNRFAALSHIRKELLHLEREDGQIPLKEFSVILNQLREGDDLSFIFERMGVRYDSLFIDEFQDTNRLQWDLLRPLVANAVSNGNYSLIVGDVKQSIYRWNGGDWKILGEEVAQDPELGHTVNEVRLEDNFRSAKEIVDFNNQLFGDLAEQFDGYAERLFQKTEGIGELAHLMEDFKEEANSLADEAYKLKDRAKKQNTQGYVELTYKPIPPRDNPEGYTPEEDEEEENGAIEWVGEKVRELIEQDRVRPMDIAVIVRTRRMAREVVAHLLEINRREQITEGFSVVSQDGLQLASSYSVGLALAGLRIIAGLGTDIDRGLIAAFQQQSPHWAWYLKKGREDEHASDTNAIFSELLELKGYPLLDAFDRACQLLGLPDSTAEKPYLDKLRDMLYTYMKGESTSIAAFVQWYDTTKGGEQSIDLVQNETSVNVLTVHKAKGLEFDVVICPDANYALQSPNSMQPTIWAEVDSIVTSPSLTEQHFPIQVSTKNLLTGFNQAVKEDFFLQMVDALNLLYVAFTRPRTALYIYYEVKLTGKEGEYRVKSVNKIFDRILHGRLSDLFNGGLEPNAPPRTSRIPESAKLNPTEESSSEASDREKRTLERIATDQKQGRRVDLALSISRKEGLQAAINRRKAAKRGERLHAIMATCPTGDLQAIERHLHKELKKLEDLGLFHEQDAQAIADEITRTIEKDEVLRETFITPHRSLAERDILLEDGTTCRPDRVTLCDGRTIILDYKFGRTNTSHGDQLRGYAQVLEQLGYPKPEAYLWYIQGAGLEPVNLG